VNIHDFPGEAVGRAVPYGIYDLQHNRGTVYVGQSCDTPEFAVDNLTNWCQTELPVRFRSRRWRLQCLAQSRFQKRHPGETGRWLGFDRYRLSLPARHLQVEPYRTPSLQ
jgi:hypothetical protein